MLILVLKRPDLFSNCWCKDATEFNPWQEQYYPFMVIQ